MARDITAILSEPQLLRLRAHFDNNTLLTLARQNLAGRYAPSSAFISPLIERFYATEAHMSATERERIVLALLAARQSHPELAVHIYWGLMVGLAPRDIAEVFLLVLSYSGTHTYNAAIGLLEGCLLALDLQTEDQLGTLHCVGLVDKVARGHWHPPS